MTIRKRKKIVRALAQRTSRALGSVTDIIYVVAFFKVIQRSDLEVGVLHTIILRPRPS